MASFTYSAIQPGSVNAAGSEQQPNQIFWDGSGSDAFKWLLVLLAMDANNRLGRAESVWSGGGVLRGEC